MSQLSTEESVEKALEDMPEVIESLETSLMSQRLQNLVSATISADLLSDRMFQLELSLNTFNQATEAFQNGSGRDNQEGDEPPSAGDVVWDMLDQQVFDL